VACPKYIRPSKQFPQTISHPQIGKEKTLFTSPTTPLIHRSLPLPHPIRSNHLMPRAHKGSVGVVAQARKIINGELLGEAAENTSPISLPKQQGFPLFGDGIWDLLGSV
jgi:hypothetical protein